eukprot:TRINITY_DN94150_c0_g1_i1.p1 TRINITY_DN94150_c0_g1~~TRINITY_DN94150_c0_g1_i1.p1  ORF type:complete len:229 (-),score=58.30 TRINITY_DN94150_c0_g1_i1:96-782(-)
MAAPDNAGFVGQPSSGSRPPKASLLAQDKAAGLAPPVDIDFYCPALSARRDAECETQRAQLHVTLQELDRFLDEASQAIRLRPSKRDKLTATNYHRCYRLLHWALGRCMDLQEELLLLEACDGRPLSSSAVGLDYSLLTVDILSRHDRATNLLQKLMSADEATPQPDEKEAGALEKPSSKEVNHGPIYQWLSTVVTSCGGRVCGGEVREPGCDTVPPSSAPRRPAAVK